MNQRFDDSYYTDGITYELCPQCDTEVMLNMKFERQTCPACGKQILPCSICEHNYKCNDCPLEEGKSKSRYFLFGDQACSDYEEGGVKQVLKCNGSGETFEWTSDTDPADLLSAFAGNSDFAEITKEDFDKLN